MAGAKWLPSDRRVISPSDTLFRHPSAPPSTTLHPPLREGSGGCATPPAELLDCRYDNARLIAAVPVAESERWKVETDTSEVKIPSAIKNGKAEKIIYRFIARTGMEQSGVAVTHDFPEWSSDNYVMIPASVYNGNRQRIVNRNYATGLDPGDYDRRDLALTSNPIPQLSPDFGSESLLEVSVCNAATPAIAILDRKNGMATLLLTEQGIADNGEGLETGLIRDHALIMEESRDRSHATAVISAPGVRGRKPEFIGFSESSDRGMNFAVGDTVTLSVTRVTFPAQDTAAMLTGFMHARKLHTSATSRPARDFYPMSHVLEVMSQNIDDRYYSRDSVEFYRPEGWDWMSYGWIGGLINTYPMLAAGDMEHFRRVSRTFDFALPRAHGESGYYYDLLKPDGTVELRDACAIVPGIGLTRKNGDILYWMIKQLELLKTSGRESYISPMWETETRKLADAFAQTWKDYGTWGGYVHVESGVPATFNTSGGASAAGGMALASKYYNCPDYLATAEEAARKLYDEFRITGFTSGGCGDILQNSDSETAIALTTSLVTLYEITGNRDYIDMAEDCAALCSTWTVSFDYRLPSDLDLAKTGANFTGAVWASTQNKHGAPGFCTLSGDALFKLYRATGKRIYAELLRDVIHAHAEGIQSDGTINERLTYCDADRRGILDRGWKTGWNETNGALMAIEIPGIYLRTGGADPELFVFDHADVEIISSSKGKTKLRITNPTPFDASYSIFAETDDDSRQPLGDNRFTKWSRKIKVKSGATVTTTIR